MGRVIAIQTGSTLVSPAVPNARARRNPLAYTMLFQRRKNRIKVPVKCFLLQVADHTLLVDTGWSAQDATHALRHLGFGLWFASEPVLTADEAVLPQLATYGITLDEIDAVAMTHLDCDHAGGLDAIAGRKHVLVSSDELAYAHEDKLRYNAHLWDGATFDSIVFTEDIDAPFGLSADLFGDGSVIAYAVPGHSKGSVVYVGHEGDRYVAIVGDTGYNQQSWTELKMPGVVYDKENLMIGLEWVRSMLADKNCAGIFCAHDPAIAPGIYDIASRAADTQGILR